MKRYVNASQFDIGDACLDAKHYVDNARDAITFLKTMTDNKEDIKVFSEYGSQLAKMSGKLQSLLNERSANPVNSSYDLMRNYLSEQDGVDYKYKLEDSYGFPQAGVDVKYFETWEDLETYLDENPDVEERIAEGYARIFDV